MTDNEIIKALECCSKAHGVRDCISLNCPLFDKERHLYLCIHGDTDLFGISLDLITRQKAEIEKLKQDNKEYHEANLVIAYQRNQRDEEIQELHRQLNGLNFMEQQIKSEAIKEFAYRLKIYSCRFRDGHDMVDVICIDNLVKEMVGDD